MKTYAIPAQLHIAESVHCVLVHVVWATLRREPVLLAEHDGWLRGWFLAKCDELRVACLAVGNASDHVYILVSLPATVALADLVQRLKGASSHAWNREPGRGRLLWQHRYWAASVSPSAVRAVCGYVSGQREHHHFAAFESWEAIELR